MQLPLAQALILQNKTEALLKDTDPGILGGHDAAVIHSLRARAYLVLRQSDQAEQEVGKALAIEPKCSFRPGYHESSLQTKGKLAEAEHAVDQALAASPELIDAHVQKGWCKGRRKGILARPSSSLIVPSLLMPKMSTPSSAVPKFKHHWVSSRTLAKTSMRSCAASPIIRLAGYFDAFLLGRAGKYQEAIERLERIQNLEDLLPSRALLERQSALSGRQPRARPSIGGKICQPRTKQRSRKTPVGGDLIASV